MSFRHKVLILDTSVLCTWFKVPGKESCGPEDDRWDFDRIDAKIQEEIRYKSTLVLPLASIIETGNHITQSNGDKYQLANALVDIINKSADDAYPWAAFSAQNELWQPEKLKALAIRWRDNISVLSMGDASIVDVAEYYSKNFAVEILTGDKGLQSYSPQRPTQLIPRRRQ